MMDTIDFNRSFIRWRIDFEKMTGVTVTLEQPLTLNNVRTPLECVAEVTELATGKTTRYALGASCKTERVNVTSGVWSDPNADFNPIFTDADQYMNIKFFDQVDKAPSNERQAAAVQDRLIGIASEAFDTSSIDIQNVPGETVRSVPQLIELINTDQPIVSLTEFANDRYKAVIQYPIKVVNSSEREGFYHVDTGPVLYPDLERWHEDPLANMHLAYIAHNCPDWAEFIVNVPTALPDGPSVHHYSKTVHVKTTDNRMVVIS